jgi:hypothetical protein
MRAFALGRLCRQSQGRVSPLEEYLPKGMAASGSGKTAEFINSHVAARDLFRSNHSRCGRLRLSDLDQQLAEILTPQESDKS